MRMDVLNRHLGLVLYLYFVGHYEADWGMIGCENWIDGRVSYMCHHGIAC